MKRLLIFIFLLCLSVSAFAEEYEIPKDFMAMLDQTYANIYQYVEIDETLSYDLFLWDEYALALSALTRGQAGEMSLREIKEYYHKSLVKYDLTNNFLLMVMVYDTDSIVDLSKFATKVGLRNSDNQILYGKEYERFNSVIFIISFPKEEVLQHLNQDQTINIQLQTKTDTLRSAIFKRNYSENIPAAIRELVEIMNKPIEE